MPRFTYRQQVLAALPGTAPQISEKSGVKLRTVRGLLTALQRDDLTHISGWAPTVDFTRWIEVHGLGPGTGPGLNVAKPALLPDAPEGMRRRERRTCYCCGKQFDVFDSDAAMGAGKFCSNDCKNLGVGPQAAVLANLPGTSEQITQRTGMQQKHAMQAVARLVKKNQVHYAGLVLAQPAAPGRNQRTLVMQYAAGPQPDSKVPAKNWDAIAYFYRQIILAAMPGTKAQIIQRTGMDHATALKHVDAMHAEGGICYIKRWRKGKQGAHMAVYQPGEGKDAPDTIKALTTSERYARFTAKPGRLDELRANQREYMRIQRMRKVGGDPLLNALFGAPAQRKQKSNQPGANDE